MSNACDFDPIQRCTAELRDRLPALANRHTPLVLMAALTEHVGGSLFLSQRARLCSAATAREIVDRVRQMAFSARLTAIEPSDHRARGAGPVPD
jgi:hypothetical protein